MTTERRQRLDALGFEWNVLMTYWEKGFSLLQKFHNREHHCWVPRDHREDDFKLGMWLRTQRGNKATLPAHHRIRLDAIGFVWDSLVAAWEEGFASLQKFYEREKNCIVRVNHIEGTFKLGQWVSHQRTVKDTMHAERRQRLDALGFIWNNEDDAWEKWFALLKSFQARERHCRVPLSHIEGTYKLGQWVANQRHKIDKMQNERRQKLVALGFEWNLLGVAFTALEQFKAREGHSRVPVDHIEGSFKLGNWVQKQRYRSDSMTINHRQQLDALGFVWRKD